VRKDRPRVSARGGEPWSAEEAEAALAASRAELRGHVRFIVYAVGGDAAFERYSRVGNEPERDALYAVHALGGEEAVVDLVVSMEKR
jgi:hypothetical protein